MRASYPDLFALIGTTYGAVDGTHFTLPDTRSKVTAGVNGADAEYALGAVNATGKTRTLLEANLPPHAHDAGTLVTDNPGDHTHAVQIRNAATGNGNYVESGDDNNGLHNADDPTGGAGGHTHALSGSTGNGAGTSTAVDIRDLYIACNKIIKALP